jgi:ABC-type branched-subunit amino acid transport system ATPase component
MRDALKRSMGEGSFAEVRERFERRIESGHLIEMESKSPARAFTTEKMIQYERDNVSEMQKGQGQHGVLVTSETWQSVRENHTHLSASQRAAVEQTLATRDKIVGLEGVAGAGKTTSLSAIREAVEREGYEVIGLAPTSRATHKLSESGIESHTLQRQLIRNEAPNDGQKRIFVIDESSLTSTRQMNEFFHRLQTPDRVLLVGDTRQHEAVEAGRPYKQLQEAGMQTARLVEIVRQKDPSLKEAVEQFARGDVFGGVASLDQQGRVHEIINSQERFTAIAREYSRNPEGTLVISPDNESRRELNTLIHREMQAHGDVSKDEHKLRVLESRQELTGADRQWAGKYEAGDVLRYSRGSKNEGIAPGDYARVAAVDLKENRIIIERENGRLQTYDPRRLSGVSVHREAEREFSKGTEFSSPRHRKNCKSLTVISALSSTSTLSAIFESRWTQVARFNSTSASIRILTTDTQSPATAARDRPPNVC